MPIISRLPQGGGSKGNYNIYVQPSEPAMKEGIWLKKDASYNNIVVDNDLYTANSWISDSLIAPLTNYNVSSVSKGGERYAYIGCYSNASPNTPYVFKYDSFTDTYTAISELSSYYSYPMIIIGDYLYIISLPNIYAYHMGNRTIQTYSTGFASYSIREVAFDGTNIYLPQLITGDTVSDDRTNFYKFDTITRTTTLLLSGIQMNGTNSAFVADGYACYMGGTWDMGAGNHNHDYSNAFWTINLQTYNVSVNYNGFVGYNSGSVVVSGKPYIVTSRYPTSGTNANVTYGFSKGIYVFNTSTKTFTSVTSTPRYTNSACNMVTFLNNKLIVFAKSYTTQTGSYLYNESYIPMQYSFVSKQYPNNTLILQRRSYNTGNYTTELLSPQKPISSGTYNRNCSVFDTAYIFVNNLLDTTCPAYYGNGTSWVSFRSA